MQRTGLTRRLVMAGGLAATPALTMAAPAPGYEILASGLQFPEGPVPMADDSVIFCEILAKRLGRWRPGGKVETVVEFPTGAPNGASLGPDGALYICNNGGRPPAYAGGALQRLDLATRTLKTLYTASSDGPLVGPNDLVFDEWGDIWFTDMGRTLPRSQELGGLYWAKADGSEIRQIAYPIAAPNGVALGPDRRTLYLVQTFQRQVHSLRIEGRGKVAQADGKAALKGLAGLPGLANCDSMAVEANGNLLIANWQEGVSVLSPEGRLIGRRSFAPYNVTNLAFGPDMRTLYLTANAPDGGVLLRARWPRPGLRLLSRPLV